MTSHSIEGLSDDKRALYAMAEAVHRGRFPSDREPTPFGELGIGETAYCYRIAKSVQRHLALPAAPSDGWVLVPREPTEAMLNASWHAIRTALAEDRMAMELTTSRRAHDIKAAVRYRAMLSAAPERVESASPGAPGLG